MAIKIRSTPSFGREVNPEAPCHKILWHVEESCVAWLRYYISRIQGHFSQPPLATAICLWCSQRALVDGSGILELRWGCTIGHKMAAVTGTLCSTPPRNSNQYCASKSDSLIITDSSTTVIRPLPAETSSSEVSETW
jgi:hypothetical protein